MRGNRKIGKYIQRLGEIHGGGIDLTVETATRMLAVVKCIEAALVAYLRKTRL